METTAKELCKNYDLLELADMMERIRDGLNALRLMTDAYLLGPEDYNEDLTADAMHLVIESARDTAEAAEKKVKAALCHVLSA